MERESCNQGRNIRHVPFSYGRRFLAATNKTLPSNSTTSLSDMSAAGNASPDFECVLQDAEDALQRGMVADALASAQAVLQQKAAAGSVKGRAINVVIQADFHFYNKLSDLQALLDGCGLSLHQLPVTAILLWGVVAVELQAGETARSLLKRYLEQKDFGEGSGVTREDALALSRLYAVQLLSRLCGDFQAAADWLMAGGAGLSEEQQELLLLEVDEAEEVAQEEQVAAWTTQDAAQAAQLGSHPISITAEAETQHPLSSPPVDAASLSGSLASTAAAALHELGPSVSGNLSSASLPPASEASHAHEHECGASLEHTHAHAPEPVEQGDHTAAALAEVQQLEHVDCSPMSPPVPPTTAAALRGLQERIPSSPSLASWRRSPDEAAVQDQSCVRSSLHMSSSPFVTMTGSFLDKDCRHDDVSSDGLAVAAAAAALPLEQEAAAAAGAGAGNEASAAQLLCGPEEESSRSSGLAPAAPVAMNGHAAASHPATDNTPAQLEQQIAAPDQQQQQSQLNAYMNWAHSKAVEAWQSTAVQDALKAVNLQDVPPWELAAGSAAAVVLLYSLYRNRRRAKRAAADFAAGVAQTAQMAIGMPVNPMAAIPGTSHVAH